MDATPDLAPALRRYQVIAWIVSVLLVLLLFVAVPLRIFGGDGTMSSIVSPIHGFGYMVYLVLAFDLARRVNWPLWPNTIGLLLAGTIPVVSIVVERKVHRMLARTAQPAGEPETAAR